MQLQDITPLILTYNEAANLRRTLEALQWARQIVVVDSLSNDRTVEICSEFPTVCVYRRRFDTHTAQWNFGLEQVQTGWVLTLDADYVCPASLADELTVLQRAGDVYFARFRYCIFGKPLRATLYPPRAVLFRTSKFRYINDGHTQVLDVGSAISSMLTTEILHDDRKPLSRWLVAQQKYAKLEAEKLQCTVLDELTWKDRSRQFIVIAPFLTLVYCLFYKRLILDGWRGVYYTMQRVYAELLLALTLLDRRLRARSPDKRPVAEGHTARSESGEMPLEAESRPSPTQIRPETTHQDAHR